MTEMKDIGNFKCLEIEDEILKWWDDENIYQLIKENEPEDPEEKFFFLDGPPYTTGNVHLGTAWNKILKDYVIKYKRMQGFRVTDTPGYDTHGLPIEVVVEKRLDIHNKKEILEYGLDKFIKQCRDYAESKIGTMNEQFKRLGCNFWNWENPYITLKNTYIQGIWWTLKKAWERDNIYQFYRPQNCCPRCATALAKHEFEYETIKDNAIFVKFQSVEDPNTYYVIWTTTPWTLVSNTNIMVNPNSEYVKMRVKDEHWIFGIAATSGLLQDKLELMVGEEDGFDYGERMKGSELEGKRYIHPLAEEVPYQAELEEEQPKVHTILLSEKYVQETGGSGMVHTAPGHGPEDYEVGVENDIPIFSPVDEKGTYTEEAGQFKGKFVHNTNQEIVDILKEKDLLVHKEEIEHEYAHCWRCKSKLVYRATPQWFFKTSDLSEKMLEENEEIYWIPESAGKNSFASWLNNLRDWCISRQRFWGIPLSIWLCENEECDHMHVVGSVEELERLAGEAPKDLHKPWIDEVTFECNECGGTMKRTPDVLDVWLDSGSVMWASQKFVDGVEHYDTWEAADFILEGKDQIRGWFNSLLCSAMVSSGRRNYNACYMHGWVNSHGIKMSKSLGNTVDPEDVIEGKIEVLTEDEKEKLAEQAREDMSSKFDKTKDIKTRHKRKKQYLKDIKKWSNIKGIETFRFYSGLGTSAGQDLNLDHKDYVDTFRILKTLWNCYKFSQGKMKLNDFKPLEVELDEDKLKNADKWMLSQTNSMIKNVTELFDKYLLHEIPGKLQKFIVNDLSRWYIRLIRDRVDPSYDGEDKAQALATLWYVLYRLTLVMAPVNPMITERLYQKMFRAVDEENMKKSVHLESWPKVNEDFIDEKMEKQMRIARRIIDNVRSIKNDHKIKLRWPTKALYVMLPEEMDLVYNDLIKNSCNVKYFEYIDEPIEEGEHIITGKTEEKDIKIYLDIEDTEEIQYERIIRDLMRTMQYMRKVQKFQISDRVELRFGTEIPFLYKALNEFEEDLKDKMNAESVEVSDEPLEDEEGWVFYNFHVCLTEGCWAWVRGKKAKQIKGGNDRKKCGYCGESLKVDKLGIITVKFKKL